MTTENEKVLYQERVLPSLSFYAVSIFIPIASFFVVLPLSFEAAVIVAILSFGLTFLLAWLSSPLIILTSTKFSVGKVQIETEYLGSAEHISSSDSFKERGPLLDTRAFTRFQPGVKNLVKIFIADDRDPTPYWLISSRNPEIIAGLINKL